MATFELTEPVILAEGAVADAGVDASRVRIAVHDASRLEWSLSLPLPAASAPRVAYALSVELR